MTSFFANALIALFGLVFCSWPVTNLARADVGGAFSVGNTYYPLSIAPDLNRDLTLLRADLEASVRAGKKQKFKFKGDLEWRPDDNSTSERVFGNIQEAYWDLKEKSYQIQLGLNTFAWGVTDGYNPLDVTNPRQIFDPLQSEKIGTPSLLTGFQVSAQFHVEALYIPFQLKSRLPGTESRWLPHDGISGKVLNLQVDQQNDVVILPSQIQYQYMPDQEWNDALKNNFGLRMQLQAGDFDLSLIGFQGAAPLPQISYFLNGTLTQVAPNYVVTSSPLIQLEADYYRENVLGGTAVATIGETIVRFETAYSAPVHPRPELPGPAEESIAGIEHSWVFGTNRFTGLLQASFNFRPARDDNSPSSLTALLDRAIFGGFRLAHGEHLQWFTMAGTDTRSHGFVALSQVTYALSDFWKAELEGLIINGSSATLLGSYNKNDRLGLMLTRSW